MCMQFEWIGTIPTPRGRFWQQILHLSPTFTSGMEGGAYIDRCVSSPNYLHNNTQWNTMKDKVLLEDVQKFALWMATKQWDSGYQDLLDIMNVPSLADRRLQLKLALLYKIVHGMSYFPSDILCPRTNYNLRTNHSLVIDQPYAHTNAYFYSFVPHTTCNCSICFCF